MAFVNFIELINRSNYRKLKLYSNKYIYNRDTTLPRSSKDEIENEGENDAFASKYCVRICIAGKCRSIIYN
jgi:hypothetical protein